MKTPPDRPTRKYRSILDTAEAQFGALGFKKANVDEIAARAGVSKPLIYRYFTGKKELFGVVVERVIHEWRELIVAEAARRPATPAESLAGVVRASLDFARSRALLRGLLARQSRLLLQGTSDVLDRGTATLRSVIAQVIERGVRSGQLRGDLALEPMVDVVTELCEGFASRLTSGRAPEADDRLLEALIQTLLHGLVRPKTGMTATPERVTLPE